MSEELNPQQKMAVEHIEGPALVLAGAGSGKTRIVTFRIARLLSMGVPATSILAVTFTNKAAAEMRLRIQKVSRSFVLTCTFHSLCARILRESIHVLGYSTDFTIFDDDDSDKLLKYCLSAFQIKDEKGLLKGIRAQISGAKNSLLFPENFTEEDPQFSSIYQLYQAKLKEYQALDFDDLLFLTVKLFKDFPDILQNYQSRWSFILIDEYQDTNAAQHQIIKMLAAAHHNVFAVGDPDQSIYSWRGANVQNILNFEEDFPGAKLISLEQNYRSHMNILQAANALIQNNPGRYEKNLWSALGQGEKIGLNICESDRAEADFVVRQISKSNLSLNDCVIFYRTNSQSRVFEDALLRQRIPYVIVGGLSFYQRREIKDILSLMRMVLAGADFIAFSRTINLPKRGLGEAAIAKIQEICAHHNLTILETCYQIVERKISCKLSLKQFEGLKSYVDTVFALKEMVKSKVSLQILLSEAVDRSSYLDHLREDPETYEERRSNLAELVSKAAEWEEENGNASLAGFLEELSLKSDRSEKDAFEDSVRLMTLHNGKGLEFEMVFLVGMEEDLLPHLNVKDDPTALEEERRLCYVGMTRAKVRLFLSASRCRFLWGTPRMMRPSRFLSEIPKEYLQILHATAGFTEIEETDFSNGDAVYHRDFGVGIVQKTYKTSLGITYDIFFPQADVTRSLVAKYAKLTPSDHMM
jgi:DNA helicase-2/ATP-dependent DNA helicase PcrA